MTSRTIVLLEDDVDGTSKRFVPGLSQGAGPVSPVGRSIGRTFAVSVGRVEADVTVTPVDGRFPGPPGAPRYRFIFSDDLVLERIDDKSRGNGLPQSPQNRLAGTHSGFATTLRVADVTDKFFQEGMLHFEMSRDARAEAAGAARHLLGSRAYKPGPEQVRVGSRTLLAVISAPIAPETARRY
jgi:hypothetical protein